MNNKNDKIYLYREQIPYTREALPENNNDRSGFVYKQSDPAVQ